MARVIWADPALWDLDAIADYIALDKPDAARRRVRDVMARVGRLQKFPRMGSVPPEIPDLPYRQLYIPPCRIFLPDREGQSLRCSRDAGGAAVEKRIIRRGK